MDKALVDSSTLFDITRALEGRKSIWAATTLRHLVAYERHHPRLTITGITVFELLEGLYRGEDPSRVQDFHRNLLPQYEVIRSDAQIEDKAASIHTKLRKAGLGIGLADTFIAATAVVHRLTLVTANTKHFERVAAIGFPLAIQNWRDA